MTRASLINLWRHWFPHPAAIARRVESERSRAAARRKAERDSRRALDAACILRVEIARKLENGPLSTVREA